MDFKQAISSCLRKYTEFNGRASRSEYWWFALFCVIVSLAASMLGNWVVQIVNLALLLPSVAVGARRLHDMGKSGWFQLVWLVPFIGWALMIYWLVQPSVGPNTWGTGPAEGAVEALPPGAA
jgi:uncharacterized membrane protein YhaH (DUF805 family)